MDDSIFTVRTCPCYGPRPTIVRSRPAAVLLAERIGKLLPSATGAARSFLAEESPTALLLSEDRCPGGLPHFAEIETFEDGLTALKDLCSALSSWIENECDVTSAHLVVDAFFKLSERYNLDGGR